MPTDPNLILNFAQNFPQIAPDPTTLLNQQLGAAKLAQFGQQQQGQNALRQIYSNPANLDANGQPTPEAMRTLMGVSPQTGFDLRQSLTQDAVAQTQLAAARAREGEEVIQEKMRIAQEAQSTYQDALSSMSPEQARRAAQDVWSQGRDQLAKNGLAGPDVMATMPTDYDPNRVGRALNAWQAATTTPAQRAQIEHEQAGTVHEQAETMAIRPRLDIERQKAAMGQWGSPEELTVRGPDGKTKPVLARLDKGASGTAASYYDPTGKLIDPATIVGKTTPTLADRPMYSDDTADFIARQAMTGDPNALRSIWGGAQLKVQVMNSLTKQAKEQWGDDAPQTLSAIDAMFAGDKSALTGLSKLRANVENFEGTALREANLALELAPKGLAGQSPAVNRWVQAGRTSLRGDADVTNLNAAVTSLVSEYARIMSSPGATGGVTSDHARAEAQGLLNNAMNVDQFIGAIETMKRSMANRVDSINTQIRMTVRDIQSGGGVSAPLSNPPDNPQSAPAPGKSAATAPANAPPLSMLKEGFAQSFKNGQVWTLRNGQPVQLK